MILPAHLSVLGVYRSWISGRLRPISLFADQTDGLWIWMNKKAVMISSAYSGEERWWSTFGEKTDLFSVTASDCKSPWDRPVYRDRLLGRPWCIILYTMLLRHHDCGKLFLPCKMRRFCHFAKDETHAEEPAAAFLKMKAKDMLPISFVKCHVFFVFCFCLAYIFIHLLWFWP